MKTLKTLLTATMTAIVLSASVLASTAAEKGSHLIIVNSANPDIKKIIVTGNTRVFLVQSTSEYVSYDQEDQDKVSIKQLGNTLRISSSDKQLVTLTVYVKNPYRIEAANSAVVKTVGKFNLDYLQVMLRDNATARIKADTKSLYTVTNDQANLELLGTTTDHIIKTDGLAVMNTEKFAALNTSHEADETAVAMNVDSAKAKRISQRVAKKNMK